ncbi:MAG TPA: hypothetical protein PLN69_00420 [bacterium]|nr:hypothetical protein [bacterium]
MNLSGELRTRIRADVIQSLIKMGAVAEKSGCRLCLVGGVVRDIVLNGTSVDADLVLEGDAIEFARKAAAFLEMDYVQHKVFGTATLEARNGLKFDIATARHEEYPEPGSLPKVKPATIEADLKRRDFTINAMAVSLNPSEFGELIDPFGGLDDIQAKKLRILHSKSFVDDPTRIFRGIRFAGRLEFEFEKATLKKLKEAVAGRAFDCISGQRIKNELKLIFQDAGRVRAIIMLQELGIDGAVVEGFRANYDLFYPIDRARKSWDIMIKHPEGFEAEEWMVYLASLSVGNSLETLVSFAKRISATRHEAGVLLRLCETDKPDYVSVMKTDEARPSQVADIMEKLPFEISVCRFAAGDEAERKNIEYYFDRTARSGLEIGGDDLIKKGYPENQKIGLALKEVLRRKRDGLVSGAKEEMELAEMLLRNTDNESIG